MKIYSEVGHGTEIRIYLPRAEASATPLLADEGGETPVAGGQERILLVEDKAEVRQMAMRLLGSLGYQTVDVDSAAAALQILDRGSTFDLLLTDIVMPGAMNGIGLAKEIRRRFPAMPIIFASGFSNPETLHAEATALGALFISKPYRKADLAERLRTALDGAAPRANNRKA